MPPNLSVYSLLSGRVRRLIFVHLVWSSASFILNPPPYAAAQKNLRVARPAAARRRGVVHMPTAWHETCSGDAHCEINFESRDGKLFADGTPFSIKGVNW